MNLEPTVCGRLAAKHQRLEIRMGEGEILRRISAQWKRSPSRAVIQLPFAYRTVGLSLRSREGVLQKTPLDRNEYAFTVAELSNVRLCCVADSLAAHQADPDTEPRLPFAIQVALEDGRTIPASTAMVFHYRAEIRSHEAFCRAFSDRESLFSDDLKEVLHEKLFNACGGLVKNLSRQAIGYDAESDRLTVELPREACEKEINAHLSEIGLCLEAFSMSLKPPFDRDGSQEWSAYQVELASVREMRSDAKLMELYQKNQRLARPIYETVEQATDQEPQRFDTLI